jgi:hypothetical protein
MRAVLIERPELFFYTKKAVAAAATAFASVRSHTQTIDFLV